MRSFGVDFKSTQVVTTVHYKRASLDQTLKTMVFCGNEALLLHLECTKKENTWPKGGWVGGGRWGKGERRGRRKRERRSKAG